MNDHGIENSTGTPAADASLVSADIVIVGAGLAGTSAAIVLARAGHSVALIDTHAVYPNEFRAEKLGEPHLSLLESLGLANLVLADLTPMDDITVYRFGRLVVRERSREYGFAYATLINALRSNLPPNVHFLVGRVASVETGPDRQSVVLNDGRAVDARLLVISTGLGDVVRRTVGIKREERRKAHSLSLAFDLALPAKACPFEALTYFGHRQGDSLAYLTLFPIGETMRANLFVYREPAEAWTKNFRKAPQEELKRMMPEIAAECGDFALSGPVEMRVIDLLAAADYRRDGVVLLGDAFCTTCPAPGVGIQRVLTDVEQLCRVHVPRWLETPGMAASKIAQFYDDPVKQAMDRRGVGLSDYSRAMVTGDGPQWVFRRWRNTLVRKAIYAGEATMRRFGFGNQAIGAPPASVADRLADDGWRM